MKLIKINLNLNLLDLQSILYKNRYISPEMLEG